MCNDSVYRNVEMGGNLLVRHSLDNADDDVLLAIGDLVAALDSLDDVRDAVHHPVGRYVLFQNADGRHEELLFDIAMVAEPFLIVVEVEQGVGQPVVGQAVVRKIFDDDAFELLELAGGVAVMLGEDFHIVLRRLLSPEEGLHVREQCLLLILHMPLDILRIFVIEMHYQPGDAVFLVESAAQLLAY